MARQSSRKRQRPLQDGLHHEVQTDLAVAHQQSQRQTQPVNPASPPSLPVQSEIGPSANERRITRQSSRKRQRPLEDSPQQNLRVKKKAKTGDQHHEVQTNLAVANQQSQRQTQRANPASPPSPPSPLPGSLPWSLPAQSEIGPSANERETTAPASPGTALPLKLTTKNLRAFDKMWRAHVRARHGSNGIPLSEVSELTRETVSEGSRQTTETTVSRSTKSKRSSAYDPEFATILRECGIYPDGDPSLLANLEELRRERDVRPSLAPSVYPDERVQYYMDENANAITELDTERMVARAFLGESPLPKSGNIPWSNLSSMTEHQTIAPQPDLYYGFRLDDIDLLLRKRLSSLIIPSVRDGAPGAPYLVFETKGREGNLEVLKRQATYVAAAAARAQFALESFGLDQPVYDNRVLAHAWTYAGGQGLLTHYGMRVSAPGPGTSREGYHMTLIKRYYVTDSKEQYRAGITAFRNCRDEAYKAAQARLDTAHERLRRMLSSQEETCVPTGALAPLPEARYKDVDDGYLAASLAPEILNHVVGGNTDSLSDSARLLQEQLPPLPEAQYKDIDDGYLAASLAPEIPNDLDGDDTDGFSDSRLLQEQLKEEYEAWLARESLTP